MNHQHLRFLCCITLLTAFAPVDFGPESRPGQAAPADAQIGDEAARKAEQLAEMQSVVQKLGVFEVQNQQRRQVKVVRKPLLHFRDDVRRHLDGTFWVWGLKGRPVATGEVWTNEPASHVWYVALASTSTDLAGCEVESQTRWSAKSAGLSFANLPSKAKPSGNPALRQTQMRNLARRFAPANTALRPNALRVHTYQDPKLGILSGALFVFAHGTNPEITLLIEAVQHDGESSWQYAVTRSSSAPLELQLDGKPVWTSPAVEPVTGAPNEPYIILAANADVAPQPGKPAEPSDP